MRPMMLARVALACSLVSLPVATQKPVAGQDQGTGAPDRIPLAGEREMRVVDVRPLIAPYRFVSDAPMLSPDVAWYDDAVEGRLSEGLPKSPVTAESLTGLLDAVFGEASEAARSYRTVQRRSVFLVDSKESVGRVATFVANLRYTIAAQISVHCLFFEAEDGRDSPAMLSLEQAGGLAARVRAEPKRVLFEGSAEGRVGDELSIVDSRRAGYVKEINVEVSNNFQISDPAVDVLETGPGFVAHALPCPNGTSVALMGLLSLRRQVGAIERKELEAKGLGYVEAPKVEVMQRLLSTRFDTNGGLLLAPGGSRLPSLRVLLTFRRLDPVPAADSYAIVPTSLLASSALRSAGFDLGLDSQPEVDFTVQGDDPNDLIQAIWKFSEFDVDATTTEKLPGVLVIHGGRGGIAGARRFAGVLERATTRSFTVELIAEQRPAGQAGAKWQRRGEPLRIHCLGDRVGVAIDAQAQAYIRDYNVEISQGLGGCDPVMDTVFDGTHAIAGVEPSPDTAKVSIAILDQALIGIRTTDAPAPKLGKLDFPTTQRVKLTRILRMKPGETSPLGPGVRRTIGTTTFDTRWHARLLDR